MDFGARALKVMVIFLCGINFAMWLLYTESPTMAAIWMGTAVAFLFWLLDDMRR